MRLLIVILVPVVVDQFRFRGYYGSQLSYCVAQVVRSVI